MICTSLIDANAVSIAVLAAVEGRRYPLRDRVMVLLSIRAGLRAKEIAMVRRSMVTDAEGAAGVKIGGRALGFDAVARRTFAFSPLTLERLFIGSPDSEMLVAKADANEGARACREQGLVQLY